MSFRSEIDEEREAKEKARKEAHAKADAIEQFVCDNNIDLTHDKQLEIDKIRHPDDYDDFGNKKWGSW